jgi:hypothetical protein
MFFQIFSVSCDCGFKVYKKCLYDLKTLSSHYTKGIKKSSEFYADFETVQKNTKKLHIKKLLTFKGINQ